MSLTQKFDANARVMFKALDKYVLRITHLKSDETEAFEDPLWYADVLLESSTDAVFEGDVALNGGFVSVYNKEGRLKYQELNCGYSSKGCFVELSRQPEELLYGWGERFDQFQRCQGKLDLSARESPEFLQNRQSYSAIPYFFSDNLYAFFLLNAHHTHWSIDNRRIRIYADGGRVDYLVILGDSPMDILEHYTLITGRPKLVPRWAFGLWSTCYPQENQFRVLQYVRQHREKQIPLDALILDYHWEERFHNFGWRKKLFPDADQMIRDLNKMGVRLGLIFTPFINQKNQSWIKSLLNLYLHNIPAGCEHDDESAVEDYENARKMEYFAHDDTARWWFGKGGMPDFASNAVAEWWNTKLKPLYDKGVAFFKNDDGEYLPKNARSHNGLSGEEYHNLYGFYYGKAIYEGMEKLDERRALIYARSVWVGSQRYPAIFLGDQHPDFKNIIKTMRAGLNMSLAGFSYWTADVFGLDGKTTPEIHQRYAQWALFSPIARYFYRPSGIDDTRYPWSFGEEVEDHFRRLVNLRYHLLPLYYSLAWKAYQSGHPIIRPLFLNFPQDKAAWRIDDQFLLGDHIMFCPVVQAGAKQRQVYFPSGVWYDFKTDRKFAGGQSVKVDAPLDQLPMFVKDSTILVLGPQKANIADDYGFNILEVHVWGDGGKYDLYDDDGLTRNYQEEAYLRTFIKSEFDGNSCRIGFHPDVKNYRPPFSLRRLTLIVHDFENPTSVLVNRQPITQWFYDADKRQLVFPLEMPVTEEFLIEISL